MHYSEVTSDCKISSDLANRVNSDLILATEAFPTQEDEKQYANLRSKAIWRKGY